MHTYLILIARASRSEIQSLAKKIIYGVYSRITLQKWCFFYINYFWAQEPVFCSAQAEEDVPTSLLFEHQDKYYYEYPFTRTPGF
ncbi:MAG: hypothetical protein D3907_10485 [Candidatus Electrothrix sp. AUS3]|nr:hypothetical protein [Candidatus Electrothrix gigas]